MEVTHVIILATYSFFSTKSGDHHAAKSTNRTHFKDEGTPVAKPAHSYFSYAEDGGSSDNPGPSQWQAINAACAASAQSPLDFPAESELTVVDDLKPLDLAAFETPLQGQVLKNTGHSVKVDLGKTGDVVISQEEGLKYKLLQFHAHWGRTDEEGSEHAVEGVHYPMEVHFVHSLQTPVGESFRNKYLVVGVFFEASDQENDAFEPIIKSLTQISQPDAKFPLEGSLRLSDFLPSNRDSFYRYNGSFTTPPCTESVEWNVFMTPVPISRSQLSRLRNSVFQAVPQHGAQSAHSHGTVIAEVMTHNFRPVQPINGRKILARVSRQKSLEAAPEGKANIRVTSQSGQWVSAQYTLSEPSHNCKDSCRNLHDGTCDFVDFETLSNQDLKGIVQKLGGNCTDETSETDAKFLRCEDAAKLFISLEANCADPGVDLRRLCQCV